jgi:nonsense-mediated mRNA decay protein 3
MYASTAATTATLTSVEIPCCLCGTLIPPNAANQCTTCLAQEFDLAGRLQRGPGGGSEQHNTIDVHQCRQCRRFQPTPNSKRYVDADPESPELLAVCLKHIPALQGQSRGGGAGSSAQSRLHLVDAGFIWTEPHSMRYKLRLTIRAELQSVQVQQRVAVELHCKWRQCPDCNREFTNRTWLAVVQLRQKTVDESKRGLASLERALAAHPAIRKSVLKIDAARNGFDFYFLQLTHAQAFATFLQKIAPLRMKTTQSLVSTDVKSNTAHQKYSLVCDVVPLQRDDLVLVHKTAKGVRLAGRLVLVDRVSSLLRLLDAAPKRQKDFADAHMDLSAETYYRTEKDFRVLLTSRRLTRFVVLDVELCDSTEPGNTNSSNPYQGPASGVTKYALADVVVARASDFGVNDETLSVVTHLGHLLQAGDVVLGYDLTTAVGGDWELDERLPASYTLPEAVLVKKVNDRSGSSGGSGGPSVAADIETEDVVSSRRMSQTGDGSKAKVSKKKQRRRRKEGKKLRELEESAARMGFLTDEARLAAPHEEEENGQLVEEGDAPAAGGGADDDDGTNEFTKELSNDPELAAALVNLEQTFAALDAKAGGGMEKQQGAEKDTV